MQHQKAVALSLCRVITGDEKIQEYSHGLEDFSYYELPSKIVTGSHEKRRMQEALSIIGTVVEEKDSTIAELEDMIKTIKDNRNQVSRPTRSNARVFG